MQKATAVTHLLSIEFHAVVKVRHSSLLLSGYSDGISDEIVDPLPRGESHAHRRSHQKHRFFSLIRLRPRSLITFSSKSHSFPSLSAVVRSNANPGISFNSGSSLVAAVTLGSEYIYETTLIIAFSALCVISIHLHQAH